MLQKLRNLICFAMLFTAGLPGMLAAALGAHVTLTDREGAPEILTNLQTAIKLNKLENRYSQQNAALHN
jgi:hypothetical protein